MSTQTDIPSHPIFDIDLEDEDYDDQEDKLENLTTTSQLRTPTELSNIYHKTNQHRKDHDRHVHFNKEVEIFLIPKRFCTFTFIRPPKQKRTSWKHIAQTDCEQVKLNPTIFRQAKKAEPLTKPLRKTNPFEWTDVQDKSFTALKHDMMNSATLTYSDMNKVFIIHTDASDIAVGAALSQEHKYGQLKLVARKSRKLNDAENKTIYHTSKNVLLS